MTTQRQQKANGRNARESTGPRTAAGKAVVRLNATKHGLRAGTIVVPGLEDVAEWEQFRADMVASLNPTGAMAKAVADRVAGLMWRLRRAERCEAVSVLADQAELEIPARPRTRGSILIDDEENMSDAELLAEREKSVIAAREQLAKLGLAGDLADRLAGLTDETPIDPASALAFVSACAEQAEANGCEDPPDSEDADALLEAAGLPPDGGAAWTAGAVRRAVAAFASAMYDKQTPDWLVNEVAECSASGVQNARTRLEEDEPEAIALRKRVTLTDAVARARRTGVNAVEAAHIARYEGHLQRQLRESLDELERLQRLGRDRAAAA